MFLTNGITQEDIDEAVELKAIIETAIKPAHPYASFECCFYGGSQSNRPWLDTSLTKNFWTFLSE